MTGVLRVMLCLFVCVSAIAVAETTQSQVASNNEQTIWNLEHAYWDHVEQNNLPAYLNLWHEHFLGWPSVSAAPVGKDHITDWITSQTAKGLAFESIEFRPARIQMSGDIAVACYWITSRWVDKNGKGAPHKIRITHTWLRDGKVWRIIGGMSMPEPEPPQN